MSTVQIIGAPQSNFVRCVRMACHEKGVGYDLVPARPHSPEVLAVVPTGKIPGFRHGDVALFESAAICEYINDIFPGAPLMPADPARRAMARQWLSAICTHVDQVLFRQYLILYFFPGTEDGKPDHAKVEAVVPKLKPVFDMLEAELGRHPYLGGDEFTLADIFLFCVVQYLDRAPESAALLAASPNLRAHYARVLARPSAAATQPPPPAR